MGALNLAAIFDLAELPAALANVNGEMKKALNTEVDSLSLPISRLIDTKSKRLRASIVLAIALSKKKLDKVTAQGAAVVELLHLASLVHDDIIDDSSTRWGKPTINRIEGVNRAIIIGDYLFAKAGETAVRLNPEIAKLTEATIAELCEGEAMELADQYNLKRSKAALLKVIDKKTASLFSMSCVMGAACAGLSANDSQMLSKFGRYFGMSFQLIDDLVDLMSSAELAGKPVGNDSKDGIYTLPIILGLNSPKASQLKTQLAKEGFKNKDILSVLSGTGAIEKTFQEIIKFNKLALGSITGLSNKDLTKKLSDLPISYFNWSLKHQFATSDMNMLRQ